MNSEEKRFEEQKLQNNNNATASQTIFDDGRSTAVILTKAT